MILSKQKCCLLSTGVSKESQKPTSVLQLMQDILATRYDLYRCWSCAELCEVLTVLMKNIYVQFAGNRLCYMYVVQWNCV